MIEVGIEPKPSSKLVPKTSPFDYLPMLPVYCYINVMHEDSKY